LLQATQPLKTHKTLWQGKQLLRQWCLSPIADLAAIADRHETIGALMAAPDLTASIAATLRKAGGAGVWGILLSSSDLLAAASAAVLSKQRRC
jgi:hypothetical protein